MKGFILTLTVLVPIAGLVCPSSNDLVMAAVPTHAAAVLTSGPDLEIATDTLAIIRWTATNPGGTDLHFGIVRYGTDPKKLNKIAKSPNRLNRSHPEMIFRVRIDGLDSRTTYYYRVESVGATGGNDGISSPVKTFQTK